MRAYGRRLIGPYRIEGVPGHSSHNGRLFFLKMDIRWIHSSLVDRSYEIKVSEAGSDDSFNRLYQLIYILPLLSHASFRGQLKRR